MKKWKNYLLMFSIFLLPVLAFASSSDDTLPLSFAIGMECFVSIHMSVFVLLPLARLFSKNNSIKIFWILFGIRAAILLFFDFFITPFICIADFLAVFIGAFIVVPITYMIKKLFQIKINNNATLKSGDINALQKSMQPLVNNNSSNNFKSQNNQEVVINCTKCGGVLKVTDKFCQNCGAPFEGNNIAVSIKPKVLINQLNFDPIFENTEDKLLEAFINREIARSGIDINSNLIPAGIKKRKNILNIIFAVLTFVYVTLIFFHVPLSVYVIGLLILFIFFILTERYSLMKYLKKEVKARPSEKISNIVMNVKSSFVTDTTKSSRLFYFLVAIALPLLIFMNPRIIYEKVDNGYAVRFYTFGLTNFKTATIPETYKGEKVVSLRGNTFSNMFFLETVNLPDTITEIRGQAFKNDINLTSVNIPTNLEYLGGGAFYNCSSIIRIELPDTLTYMGGETFYGASSLSEIKLSENLTEIRGSTFENCKSLTRIEIPDKVTRIGGHAFYNAESLSEVKFSQYSRLEEIGSSAFRRCDSLYSISLPYGVVYNDRAFKESPTKVEYFNSLPH